MNKLLTLISASLITACAANAPKEQRIEDIASALETFHTVPCCLPLANLIAEQAKELKEAQDFRLGDNHQRFTTPIGSGYLAAIRLPDKLEPYHFSVYSYPVQAIDGKLIAIPIVLVLNEDFTVSRYSTINMLEYWKEEAFWDKHERLSLFVRIDRQRNPSERYMVVTTPEKTYGQQIIFSRRVGGGISVIPLGKTTALAPNPASTQSTTFVSSPEGRIRITNISSPMAKPFDRFIYF